MVCSGTSKYIWDYIKGMVGIHVDTMYHIYAKDRCIYNCLEEEEFEETWEMLKVMVGILKTDYTESDISYVKVKGKVGFGGPGKVIYTEPMGDDSY